MVGGNLDGRIVFVELEEFEIGDVFGISNAIEIHYFEKSCLVYKYVKGYGMYMLNNKIDHLSSHYLQI